MTDSHIQPGTELLPCPFCGSAGIVEQIPMGMGCSPMNRASCHSCGCSLLLRADAIDAIDAWNTRATPAQPAGIREKMVEIIMRETTDKIVADGWDHMGSPNVLIQGCKFIRRYARADPTEGYAEPESAAKKFAGFIADAILALPAERPAVAQPVKPFDLNDPRPIWEQGRGNAQAEPESYRETVRRVGAAREKRMAELIGCLESIANMPDGEPRQPDDADWRFRCLSAIEAAKNTLAHSSTVREGGA